MEKGSKPVLNDRYYLNNFQTLIDFVKEHYIDLLKDEEVQFLEQFDELTEDAQRLFVRLSMRKGPYFKVESLFYDEIDDIKSAVNELSIVRFFKNNPREHLDLALSILSKEELTQVAISIDLKFQKSWKKDHLLIALAESKESTLLWEKLEGISDLIWHDTLDLLQLFKLLFFGNFHQEWHEFILEDLGVLKYEKYEISSETRLFSSREVVDGMILLNQFRQEVYLSQQEGDVEYVIKLASWLLGQDTLSSQLKSNREKNYFQIARWLEKFKLWEICLTLYAQVNLFEADERVIRILEKINEDDQAIELLEEVLKNSNRQEEIEFAFQFLQKIKRKKGFPYEKKRLSKYQISDYWVDKNHSNSVEENALFHFKKNGWQGFYTENIVWNAIFGLSFWEQIFEPVRGVFFNPFQRGPMDLFTENFKKEREEILGKRKKELEECVSLKELVLLKFKEKRNVANHFVNWRKITEHQLEAVLSSVPKESIVKIMDRMLGNLSENRSGFPDLFLYKEDFSKALLVEVKGPGDQLQSNQKKWLSFFKEVGVEYDVAKITWNSEIKEKTYN